ncbi:MAG TPA: arsenate reductase ArsC [Anaerolineales bacterium]|nr:arsenate reductase ArsC [Anaerolineales bacterium]
MVKAKVLFVCIENSCRSQMAEGLARLRAADVLEPASAGSRPSGQVNPSAVEVMGEIGYDLSPHFSKSLTVIPARRYDYVITMGCGDECPFIPADHHEDWDIPDPKGRPLDAFRAVRDTIEDKVRDLAERVRRGQPR